MRTKQRPARLFALAVGLSLIAVACGSDDSGITAPAPAPTDEVPLPDEVPAPAPAPAPEAGPDPAPPSPAPDPEASGGTLIWAHEQEPPNMHVDDPASSLLTTTHIRAALLEGLHGVSSSVEYYNELLASDGVLTENADGSVTAALTLRDGLIWSDGDPLTTRDVKFTFDVIVAADGVAENGAPAYIYRLGSHQGYDNVTDFTVVSDTEFTITWESFFAGWQSVLGEIYPAHMYSDDPNTAAAELNDSLPDWSVNGTTIPSSGPMLFDSWQKGVQMNLVRNDLYHGSNSPDAQNKGVALVDGVQINFVTNSDAQISALVAREAHIIFTQPQLTFEQLSKSDEFTVSSSAGPSFEHWGFNLNNVHLSKVGVREGLAFAMDKGEVMEALYTPLFGDSLPAEGLGNTYWLSNQSAYENHSGDAGYGTGDIALARAAIESEGYVLNGDGIFEHPTDGVLSLRIGTTGGNRIREVQQQLVQAQMIDAGIEVVIENVEGGGFFGVLFGPDHLLCAVSGGQEGNCNTWDIAQFAWNGGPWPGGNSSIYRTGDTNNTYGYSNEAFDARAGECDATVDVDERADCYNELDTYVTTLTADAAGGLFMLPITQKPTFYGYTSELATAGVAPDAAGAGPLANVGDFSFA